MLYLFSLYCLVLFILKHKMLFILAFVSCAISQPIAIVSVDYSETEFIYVPEGHTGFIVAAPFDQEVF